MSTVNANPLLLEWLKQIYELAKERGSKGVTTYKRAFESMKACPLTFNHPSEAQQLDGIGPKLCERLTKKLEEHCQANGLPMPAKGKRKRQTDEKIVTGDPENEISAPVKKPRKKRPYVPALRSGPYALILALSSLPEDSLQSLSKAELQVLAQPHCDSSFTVPSEANKFYTAWSSMKTLVEKDLVQEKGRPTRKYNLSDEGWEVARRIKAVQIEKAMDKVAGSVSQEMKSNLSEKVQMRTPIPGLTSGNFLALAEDSEWETRTNGLDRELQHTSPRLGEQRLGARSAGQRWTMPSAQEREGQPTADSNFIDLLSSPEHALNSHSMVPRSTQVETQVAANLNPSKIASKEVSAMEPAPSAKESVSTVSLSEASGLPSFDTVTIAPGLFTVQLVLDTREVRAKNDRDYIHDQLAKQGIKPLLRALELGDFFWVAKLNDPCTLAHHGEGVGEISDELALDWIVERKRLDDLVGSIKDGRFSEQKFRLNKSGIKSVIYLIEEFTLSTETEIRFHDAIKSAIASTQVVNDYFVKKTRKLDETIDYVARLTRMLKKWYENQPLYLIPSKIIDRDNCLPLLRHLREDPIHFDRSYHLTYPTFASVVSKSDNLTLRDVFIRMLMCTRGISAEKALAMQKIWNTPRALIEAYEACGTERGKQTLVAERMAGIAGRAQIKGALSQKIADMWGTKG